MREIKFRGKSADGKWCYGDLLRISGGTIIYHGSHTESEGLPSNEDVAVELMMDEVTVCIPSTIGQFTGYQDYYDNDIYEGDILYCKTIKESIATDKHAFREVVFQHGSFRLRDWFATTSMASHIIKAWEVVGNIYDNPELVEIVNGRAK